jgi:putative membrane protein
MLITAGLITAAAAAGGPAGFWHPGWDGPGGWWVVFPIAWFVLIATAVTAFVVLGRRRGRLSGQRAGERRLAERYAAGEIDEDEYRARLTTLKAPNRA